MRHWRVQDAEARFGEMLDASLEEGPQVVSREGQPQAVLVSLEQWESVNGKLKPDGSKDARPNLKDLLLGPGPRFDLDLPPRGQWKLRGIPDFD